MEYSLANLDKFLSCFSGFFLSGLSALLRASLSQEPDNHRDCGETAAAAEQYE